ncbi:MAG: NAD(P)/FAD-dependent oxidoreductase [Rhodospirillales bacterium]|nr:NAD(P)/FAD-dependent oxidoreductase [Rhodospirillales bacterium]
MTTDCEVAVIGAGHNGLVCAAYLAKAGLKVRVFERRAVVGGAAVTEEFHPGFRNSVCAYTVSLLNRKVVDDLDLYGHGLRIVERPLANFLPLEGGGYLKAHGDPAKMQVEVRRHSTADADALPDYEATLDRVARVLRSFILETPPNLGGGVQDLWRLWKTGRRFNAMEREDQRDFADIMTLSADEFLSRWFVSDAVKALFAFDGVVGNYASPSMPGTAYVLLHHCFGDILERPGAWGHAIGGMGAITQAMAKAAEAAGVVIETSCPVAAVETDDRGVRGLALVDGRVISARAVAANLHPGLLVGKLLDSKATPPAFQRRIARIKSVSATFRMNVALSELPDFACLPGTGQAQHHTAGIIFAPSVAYMERAYRDARDFGWSSQPIVEMLIPSTIDDTLAPAGRHVASLFCQHFDPHLSGGRSWDDCREEAAEAVIDTVNAQAPNFRQSILGRQILSPLDLEREFGLVGGDIFHGALSLNQLFSARPTLGNAAYRMPVRGLYLCGAGAHPGGGVTGAPGHNAAREILKDL